MGGRGLCSRWAATAAAATAAAADCDDEEEELWVGRPSNHAIATGLVADVEAAGEKCTSGTT